MRVSVRAYVYVNWSSGGGVRVSVYVFLQWSCDEKKKKKRGQSGRGLMAPSLLTQLLLLPPLSPSVVTAAAELSRQ